MNLSRNVAPQVPTMPASSGASADVPPSPKAPVAIPAPVASPVTAEKGDVSLEDENARLKEQRTCKVCMDGEVRNE